MSVINRANYEAYFLDFSEGSLSASDVKLLQAFLEENPDLQAELDSFEYIKLPRQNVANNWDQLKKPDFHALEQNEDLRYELYFAQVEGILLPAEKILLEALLEKKPYQKEFALWQKTRLQPGNEYCEKSSLFQFGLDQPLSPSTYPYYLIARTEKLLSRSQNDALETYAAAKKGGANDLALADKMILQPPLGAFFPQKSRLYKKDKSIIPLWLYQVGAVAAVLILALFVWKSFYVAREMSMPVATKKMHHKVFEADTLKSKSDISKENIEDKSNEKTLQSPASKPTIAPLKQWEVYEPDFLEIAENAIASSKLEITASYKADNVLNRSDVEKYTEQNSIDLAELKNPHVDRELKPQALISLPSATVAASPIIKYETLPELAETALAERLKLSDDERDNMALAIAKKVSTKAGETLNASLTTTGFRDDDQSLSYTLRIGSFTLSHSKGN